MDFTYLLKIFLDGVRLAPRNLLGNLKLSNIRIIALKVNNLIYKNKFSDFFFIFQ